MAHEYLTPSPNAHRRKPGFPPSSQLTLDFWAVTHVQFKRNAAASLAMFSTGLGFPAVAIGLSKGKPKGLSVLVELWHRTLRHLLKGSWLPCLCKGTMTVRLRWICLQTLITPNLSGVEHECALPKHGLDRIDE